MPNVSVPCKGWGVNAEGYVGLEWEVILLNTVGVREMTIKSKANREVPWMVESAYVEPNYLTPGVANVVVSFAPPKRSSRAVFY